VIYTFASFSFLKRGIEKEQHQSAKLKDWIKVNAYVSLFLCSLFFLNGTVVNEQDYDISSGSITNFPATTTANLVTIQFAGNNLNVPIGNMANVVTYTANGISTYSFNFNANAFNLFANGCLLKPISDYSTATNSYTITPTPDNASTILLQQTFASAGAA
jgi:hypothetical protein